MPRTPAPVTAFVGARVLCLLADSITTDHISPAGSIRKTSQAGQYLIAHGCEAGRISTRTARGEATTR